MISKNMKKHRREISNFHFKPFWAIFLVIVVLIINPISAELTTIDNIKQYDSQTQTVTIVNTFGIGRDISTIQLNTPLNMKVGAGYQKVAEFEVNLFDDDYTDAFKKMEFYNARDMSSISRQFDYKYKTIEIVDVNDYETQITGYTKNGTVIYEQVLIGTYKEEKEVWKDLDTSILTKGNITIGIFTDVQVGDYVEWIPTLFGKRIDEWATWTESLNVGLVSYYKFDEATASSPVIDIAGTNNGTNFGAANITGKIFSAYDFELSESDNMFLNSSIGLTTNKTISAWIKLEADITAGTQQVIMAKDSNDVRAWTFQVSGNTGGSNNLTYINGPAVPIQDATTDISSGIWTHVAITFNDGTNDLRFYVNGTNTFNTTDGSGAAPGNSLITIGAKQFITAEAYFDGGIDELSIWNRTLLPAEIIKLYNNNIGISFPSSPTVTLNSPANNTNTSITTINFNGTVTPFTTMVNVSLIIDNVYNQTNTSSAVGDYLFSDTFADGTYSWLYEGCDTVECTNSSVREFTIDTINPAITLISPVGQIASHSIGNPLFLNWTVIDANLDTCQYDYNGINTTVPCLDNTTTFNTILGQQNITFYANDSFSNENSETTSWTYAFLETNTTFNTNAFETSAQIFEINVTTDINILFISAFLTYNGTNSTSTTSCESGNCTINNVLDIPLVNSGEFENKSFFWTLSIFNGTESISIKTSTRQQNVSRIHLEECDATFTTQTLNFTTYDEQDLSRIDPFLFTATFNQWLGNGNVKRQSNFTQLSTSEEALCILPITETYFIDATIEYDEAGNESLYTLRNYYFQNDTINNVSVDTFLYLLLSSESTSFILKVQDDSLLPVANTLIEINRFYSGTNEFRIVQIAKTDDLGKSVGFFETEIVDYKFLITFNNATLLETGLQKVIPETSPFTLTFNIGGPLGEPWKTQDEIEDLNSSLVLNDSSGIVTYEYIDTSNIFSLARLFVIRQSLVNQTDDTLICNENSSLTSAILTCNVSDIAGFYVASAFITRLSVEELDLQITFQIETLSSVVGLLGLFFGWFLILIASFMFKFNEIAGIWAVTITMFLINLIGLINFGGVFVTATIGLAIILTWIMEK